MSQLSLHVGNLVKSIVNKYERKDRSVFRSVSDDEQSLKSAYSTFFDTPNGVVRDRRLLIEERIRKSRLTPERILPKLRSKKFSKYIETNAEEYQCSTTVSSSSGQRSSSASPNRNLSGNFNTDVESLNNDSRNSQGASEELLSENVSTTFEVSSNFKTGLCNIFAEVSPIYEIKEKAQQERDRHIAENLYSPQSFTDQYKIDKSGTVDEQQNDGDDDEISLFTDNSSQSEEHQPPQYEEESLYNLTRYVDPYHPSNQTVTGASIAQMSNYGTLQDDVDLSVMASFLLEAVGCTEKVALQYGGIFVKNGIPKVDILKRRLIRDSELLLNLGIDEEMSAKIMEILITPEEIQHMERKKSEIGKSKFKFEVLPSEVAQLYQRATQQSDNSATDRLLELSYQGNKFAQGYVMRMYAIGQGNIEKNVDQAQELGKQLAPWLREIIFDPEISLGTIYGMYAKYLLAVCYTEGLGMRKDHREAFNWYKQSAELGYDAAQAYLAHCYYIGQGVVKDLKQSFYWYQQSATQGYAAAQCNLGICYENGEGTKKDLEEAVKWFTLACAQNDSKAQYNLGRCYEKGLGVIQDYDKALYYYRLSADQGHPAAQYSQGLFYFSGNSAVEQNFEEAFFWFSRSAALNYALAQCKLGLCFEKGLGTEKSLENAVVQYQLSANQGEPSALYYLGYCYSNGLGIEKDAEKAIEYYRQSAEKGYPAAQNNLGFCYFSGTGVRKNYSEATKWYLLSAKQGYPPAQYNIAYCYEKGLGVPKKTHEMLKWYRKAADQGQKKASKALERLHF